MSRDGKLLASGSKDATVRVWDMATGAEVSELRGHEGWVQSVAFSPDGTRIVSGGIGTAIRVWNVST